MSSLTCAGDLFDRDVGVDAVLVQQIDRVDSEALQRTLGGLLDVLGRGYLADVLAVSIEQVREFGGDHHLAAERSEGLAHKFLVDERAVDLGCVKEGDAAVHGGVDHRDHLLPVRLVAVAAGHAHTTQPDGRDLQTIGTQSALFHCSCSCSRRTRQVISLPVTSSNHDALLAGSPCQ